MATRVYVTEEIKTIDGKSLIIGPLKIKYLREFMDTFQKMKETSTEEETIDVLVECTRIVMKQYCPEISNTKDDIENNFNLPSIYKIIDVAGGVETNKDPEESEEKIKGPEEYNDKSSWERYGSC